MAIQSLEIKIEENGNLTLKLPKGELEEQDLNDEIYALSQLLEPCWSNGQYYVFDASQLGHMSEAPLIAEDASSDDNGAWTTYGRVWWYPDYQVSNCMEELRENGEVTFAFAYNSEE